MISRKVNILCLFFLSWSLIACSQSDSKNTLHLHGQTMGTQWHITTVKLEANSHTNNSDLLNRQIEQELVTINQQFSTYIPESEISQFNTLASTQPFKVSQAIVDVVNTAQLISKKTQGAFDITVAPLVDLWGFGSEILFTSPDKNSISRAKKNTGNQYLTARDNPPQLVKAIPQLKIDLSAIAKGYAVDRVAALLESQGITNYLVEIGGEIRVKGHNPRNEVWHIAIEKPTTAQREAHQIINLKDISVATSGDYNNYFEENGVRYSHTIDPKTGKPITHPLASVTVLHESAAMADGLATAIMVMGDKKGLKFAKQEGLQVYMIIRTVTGFDTLSTLDSDK